MTGALLASNVDIGPAAGRGRRIFFRRHLPYNAVMPGSKMDYDLAVIGAGPAGYAAALTAAGGGLKTVLIDKDAAGGACLNRGCVPAKTWLAASHIARTLAWGKKLGLPPAHPDYPLLRAHQAEVVGLVQKGLLGVFKKKGVELLRASAAFLSPTSCILDDGRTVTFKKAVIAVGTRPVELFGAGDRFFTSDTVFALEAIPGSIAIVGAGAIGIEMAVFFSQMGSRVTLLEALPDILPLADAELRQLLRRELKKMGVDVRTGVKIAAARSEADACRVELEDGAIIEAEVLLAAAGRRPASGALGLEKAGVRVNSRGFIETDGTMGTSQEGIYAAGDVAGKALLAYTAHHEGVAAARNIMGHGGHVDYRFVPAIVFSDPEVAWVGQTEEQLNQKGIAFKAGRYHVRALARAQASGEIAGLIKVLVGEDKSILGVHLAAPHATELIHTATVAMAAGMKADVLAELPFGHPTYSEGISLAAADALGTSIY